MIDQAEFSKVGIIHSSMSGTSAYFVSSRPVTFETNTACIFIPAELPATEFQKLGLEFFKNQNSVNTPPNNIYDLTNRIHAKRIVKKRI